jgi:AcrR family transcriptional regulator
VPTGVHLRDARELLFDAAERVMLRDGPGALTGRAVTAEAGVAKGVLHRHFTDFDAFLAELIEDRIGRIETQASALRASAGTSTVVDNLTSALIELFSSVAVVIVPLLIFRDELRARLRRTTPTGLPVLTEAGAMITSYLTAERDLGRLSADADIDTLAPTLLGASHLQVTERESAPLEAEAVRHMVSTVLAGVLREPPA